MITDDRNAAEKFYSLLESSFPRSLVVGPELDKTLTEQGIDPHPERLATYVHHIRHKMERVVFTISHGRKVYAYLLGTPKGIRFRDYEQNIVMMTEPKTK